MREILFRGKRIGDDKWVYGGIIKTFHPNFACSSADFITQTPNCYAICANNKDIFVDQETIGQYTGIKDKKGKMIFEGDIVKVSDFEGGHSIGKVVWNDDACCYRIYGNLFDFGLGIYRFGDIKVIGNIYDKSRTFGKE